MKNLFSSFLIFSLIFITACSGISDNNDEKNPPKADLENEVNFFLNENLDSNVVYAISTPNGEKMIGFSDENDTSRKVKTITIETPEGDIAVVSLNENGLPQELKLGLETVTYSNYTETTVDILLERSNGVVEEFLASSYVPPETKSASISASIFPTAYALEGEDVIHGASIAINVIGCGAGVTLAYVSGGGLAPLTYLSCAGLVTRIATWKTNIGPCKGDIVQCTFSLVFKGEAGDVVVKYVEVGFDAIFPKGITLKGTVVNAITGTPIRIVSINVTDTSGTTTQGDWEIGGGYEFYFKNGGSYNLNIGGEGFTDTVYPVSLSDSRMYVSFPGGGDPFNYGVSNDEHQEIFLELAILPDAWVNGEVIDAKEGEPLTNVDITLLDAGKKVATDFTGNDGEYAIQPPLAVFGKEFILEFSKEGYDPVTTSIFISYEVKNNSDQYEIEGWNGLIKMQPEREEGSYISTFKRSYHEEGEDFFYYTIDETTTGEITFNFTKEGEGTCNATMRSVFSGSIGDEILNGTGDGITNNCSGTIDENGVFNLKGVFSGTIYLDGETGSGDGGFTVSGEIIDDKATGTIYVDELEPIPFPS